MKTRLRQYRLELSPKVTQERIAQQAGVTMQWYRQLENNPQQATSYTTALSILAAINAERSSRNLGVLELAQLGMKIV